MNASKVSITLLAPTCDAKTIACATSLNGWITTSGVLTLQQKAPGVYSVKAPWHGQAVSYKYLVGGWDGVELDTWGNERPNRHYAGEAKEIHDYVPQFKQDGRYYQDQYLPIIERLPSNMPLPRAYATRRITALLPYDYARDTRRRYPVLYLQDGQNLFDEYAPYGNWELDRRLAWLAERGWGDFIVVAIDHAEQKRIEEYSPPTVQVPHRGDALEYGNFLVQHLKPLIDRTYRTDPLREATAIGGSSMGGLVSLYVAMQHYLTFGRVMVMSPSIWLDPDLTDPWPVHGHGDTHLYLYGGMKETKATTATFARLTQGLRALDRPRRRILVDTYFEPDGEHNEAAWGRAFPRAAQHLLS